MSYREESDTTPAEYTETTFLSRLRNQIWIWASLVGAAFALSFGYATGIVGIVILALVSALVFGTVLTVGGDPSITEESRKWALRPLLSLTGVYLVTASFMVLTGNYAKSDPEPVDKAQLKACETEVEALQHALQEVLREKTVTGESGFGG